MKSSILWFVLLALIIAGCAGGAAASLYFKASIDVGVSYLYAAVITAVGLLISSYIRRAAGWLAAGNALAVLATSFFLVVTFGAWFESDALDLRSLKMLLSGERDYGWGGSMSAENVAVEALLMAAAGMRAIIVPLLVYTYWRGRQGTRAAGFAGITLSILFIAVSTLPALSHLMAAEAWRLAEFATLLRTAVLLGLLLVPACLIRSPRGWNSIRWVALGAAALLCGVQVYSLNVVDARDYYAQAIAMITLLLWTCMCLIHFGLLAVLRPGHEWMRWGYFTAMGVGLLIALGLFSGILFGRSEIWSGGSGALMQSVFAADLMLLSGAGLALMVTHVFDKEILSTRPMVADGLEMTGPVECMRCKAAFRLKTGENACPACGLVVQLAVQSPACAECGYLLVGHAYERCPECGVKVRKTEMTATSG